MICSNNRPDIGLANGDVGVVIGEGSNRRLMFLVFNSQNKLAIRFIHPARVQGFEPALAMTIHKSQGSEADRVILLWPDKNATNSCENELAYKNENHETKLLYTAITRARKTVDLIIPKES